MILIIMRHGEAEPYQASDQLRALTSLGERQSTSAAKQLVQFFAMHKMSNTIENVLVSPYVRTQQTFNAANKVLTFQEKTDTDTITPMGDISAVHDIIDGYAMSADDASASVQKLMLISHMPLVSLLADELCSGFNGKIFDTADTLVIDYDHAKQIGKQLTMLRSCI